MPGEQPQGGKFIKLNTNENPYPASPAVKQAIAAALERGLARYPDPMCTAFRRRAGEVLGVDADWILCGNGSDDILTIVTRALVGQRQWLRMPTPSYILYARWLSCRAQGRGNSASSATGRCPINSPQPREDLRLAFLPNPNSPSGTMLSPGAGAGNCRAVALPAVGRRGVRRLCRDELPVAGRQERKDHGLALAEQVVCAGRACDSGSWWRSRN